MKKIILYASVVLLVLSLVMLSGCVENETKMQSTPSPASETMMVTIDSLPAGATVFIQDKEKPNEPLNAIGSTPLKVELVKGKKYKIWLFVSLDQYRKITRDIPEIQKRLDDFQRDEKIGSVEPGHEDFFEMYTGHVRILESDERLDGFGIPIDVYVSYVNRDKMRIAGVFVPAGMNPEVLLPLVDNSKSYNISKADLVSILQQNNAPENLADSAYNLLTKTGVALVTCPEEPLNDGTSRKTILHITTSDMDDDSRLTTVARYTAISGNAPTELPTVTPRTISAESGLNELKGLEISGSVFRLPPSSFMTEIYFFDLHIKNSGTNKISFDKILFNLYDGKSIMIRSDATAQVLDPGQEVIVKFNTGENGADKLQKNSEIRIYLGFFENNRRLDGNAAFRTSIPKLTDIPGPESFVQDKLYKLDFRPVGVEMREK